MEIRADTNANDKVIADKNGEMVLNGWDSFFIFDGGL
jgi:hypothetical protein